MRALYPKRLFLRGPFLFSYFSPVPVVLEEAVLAFGKTTMSS